MMIELKDVTFIIPVGIESTDRAINTEITISYLCKHLNTNIIIYEFDRVSKVSAILDRIDNGQCNITHHFEEARTDVFHRTKFLNEMIMMSTTQIVVNYDVDILLQPNVYAKCADKIRNGRDLVYPYFWGHSQRRIHYPGRDKIRETLDLNSLCDANDMDLFNSQYGHCQFFNRNSYIAGGMENEGFIAYAPEDQERGYRFDKLGYKVEWSDDYVYHIEHTRGANSSLANPLMTANNSLFEYIKTLSKDELIKYYQGINTKYRI